MKIELKTWIFRLAEQLSYKHKHFFNSSTSTNEAHENEIRMSDTQQAAQGLCTQVSCYVVATSKLSGWDFLLACQLSPRNGQKCYMNALKHACHLIKLKSSLHVSCETITKIMVEKSPRKLVFRLINFFMRKKHSPQEKSSSKSHKKQWKKLFMNFIDNHWTIMKKRMLRHVLWRALNIYKHRTHGRAWRHIHKLTRYTRTTKA